MLGALLVALGYAILERNPTGTAGAPPTLDDSSVVRLYEEKRSGEMVEGVGIVERVLRDDEDGSRHQRFIVRLGSGLTLLVSHNIDLAPRVANLEPGDDVLFRGQYEWNDQGGVIHWTHDDPEGRRHGGWMEHEGVTYRQPNLPSAPVRRYIVVGGAPMQSCFATDPDRCRHADERDHGDGGVYVARAGARKAGG